MRGNHWLRWTHWIWINSSYNPTEQADPAVLILNPIHVSDGRQYVYWETQDASGQWTIPHYLRLGYRGVRNACDVLRVAGAPGVTYRLSRWDRTPLLTVRDGALGTQSGRRKWIVKKWPQVE